MKLCAVIALLEKMIKLLNLIQSVFHSLCLIVTKLGTVVFPENRWSLLIFSQWSKVMVKCADLEYKYMYYLLNI